MLLASAHFAGDFPTSVPCPQLPTSAACQQLGAAVDAVVRAGNLSMYRTGNRQPLELCAHGAARQQWRAMTNPDFVVAAPRSGGASFEEALLEGRCALAYELSAGQGTSSDATSVVLEIVLAGCALTMCRAAHLASAARGQLQQRAWSACPVMVCALPPEKTWRTATRQTKLRRHDPTHGCRVWYFQWRAAADGVDVYCSDPCAPAECLDFMLDHVSGAGAGAAALRQ